MQTIKIKCDLCEKHITELLFDDAYLQDIDLIISGDRLDICEDCQLKLFDHLNQIRRSNNLSELIVGVDKLI